MLVCERVLGARPVALLRGEARVGRIGLRHLHALAAVLGVGHHRTDTYDLNDRNDHTDDAEARAKALECVLDSWCGGSPFGVASVSALTDALHHAGMDFHANAIRAVNHERTNSIEQTGFGMTSVKTPSSMLSPASRSSRRRRKTRSMNGDGARRSGVQIASLPTSASTEPLLNTHRLARRPTPRHAEGPEDMATDLNVSTSSSDDTDERFEYLCTLDFIDDVEKDLDTVSKAPSAPSASSSSSTATANVTQNKLLNKRFKMSGVGPSGRSRSQPRPDAAVDSVQVCSEDSGNVTADYTNDSVAQAKENRVAEWNRKNQTLKVNVRASIAAREERLPALVDPSLNSTSNSPLSKPPMKASSKWQSEEAVSNPRAINRSQRSHLPTKPSPTRSFPSRSLDNMRRVDAEDDPKKASFGSSTPKVSTGSSDGTFPDESASPPAPPPTKRWTKPKPKPSDSRRSQPPSPTKSPARTVAISKSPAKPPHRDPGNEIWRDREKESSRRTSEATLDPKQSTGSSKLSMTTSKVSTSSSNAVAVRSPVKKRPGAAHPPSSAKSPIKSPVKLGNSLSDWEVRRTLLNLAKEQNSDESEKPNGDVAARSPIKTKSGPGSPTKAPGVGGAIDEASRERRIYHSRYGTWREMQRLSKDNMKQPPPDGPDTTSDDVRRVLEKDSSNGVANAAAVETVAKRIRADRFLSSLCKDEEAYLAYSALALTGVITNGSHANITTTQGSLDSRTNVLSWYTLERLRRLWQAQSESRSPHPSLSDLTSSRECAEVLRAAAKLCFGVTCLDVAAVTGVIENDRRNKRVYVIFRQQGGVRMLKRDLEAFGVARLRDRGPFFLETGNFVEASFSDLLLVDFLGCAHAHAASEDVGRFPKSKLATIVPFLCGLATSKVSAPLAALMSVLSTGSSSSRREPEAYVRHLQGTWLETQQTYLSCVFEAKMRNVAAVQQVILQSPHKQEHLKRQQEQQQQPQAQQQQPSKRRGQQILTLRKLQGKPQEKKSRSDENVPELSRGSGDPRSWRLPFHDLVQLSYYLENVSSAKAVESVVLRDCGLDDASLKTLARGLVQHVQKLTMTGNFFTFKGFYELTRHLKSDATLDEAKGDTSPDKRAVKATTTRSTSKAATTSSTASVASTEVALRSLDLSDSNVEDESLIKLCPLLPHLETLCLADNFLTWYGLRKVTQPQRRTKRLKCLDLTRCHLHEHAFYELMPLVIRTETVVLDGNDITPLEMKIFARQVREAGPALKLGSFSLGCCNADDEVLSELSKFASFVPSLDLHGNAFSAEGVRVLTRACRKHLASAPDTFRLRSLSLRGCGLDEKALAEVAELVPVLESVTLSHNNFASASADVAGVRALSKQLLQAKGEKRTAFIDLRQSKLNDASKKLLAEVARHAKLEIKLF